MTPVVMIILVALGNQYVDASESTPPKRVMRRYKQSMGTYPSSRSISPEGSSMEPALMGNKDEEVDGLSVDLHEEGAQHVSHSNASKAEWWRRRSTTVRRRQRRRVTTSSVSDGCKDVVKSACECAKENCRADADCKKVIEGSGCTSRMCCMGLLSNAFNCQNKVKIACASDVVVNGVTINGVWTNSHDSCLAEWFFAQNEFCMDNADGRYWLLEQDSMHENHTAQPTETETSLDESISGKRSC